MRIVQLTAPASAGGAERVIESLAVGHHRRGHNVTVAALAQPGRPQPFLDLLSGLDVRVHRIGVSARAYRDEQRHVAALCRSLVPDVVHIHGYRMEITDQRVVAGLGIPTVTTIHGATKFGGLKGRFLEWVQRRNYRRFDAVVAVSTPLFEETLREGVDPERLHLIPNAWSGFHEPLPREDARKALGLDPESQVVGWVGRLFPVKGADVLLDAVSRLPEPRPTAVIIGYGPEKDRLESLVGALKIGASVRFYPEIRDAGRYFRAFDTYVLSSRSEGLPIVLLEAMAAGTPIVATRVGGVPDALRQDESWLVPSEDAASLADAIHRSLTDPAEAARRAGRAAARLKEEFSLQRFLDRYEAVYRGVVGH